MSLANDYLVPVLGRSLKILRFLSSPMRDTARARQRHRSSGARRAASAATQGADELRKLGTAYERERLGRDERPRRRRELARGYAHAMARILLLHGARELA